MRVCLCAPFPPPSGGIAVHAQRLAMALEQQGVRVNRLDLAPLMNGVMSSSRAWRALRMAPAVVGLRAADVIHLHGSVALRAGLGVRVLRRRASRMIVSIHGGGFRARFDALPRPRRQSVIRLLADADRVCVASDAHRVDVSAALPALSGKLVVVEPVLLTPRLLGYYESVTRQGGVIGSTGLWDRTYDFGTVIQVFETLRTQQPELVSILELAVSTAGADPEYRREILTKIAASAYAPFIAVFEDHPDVLTRIARWSALLRATVRDSYGMAVREAIALGTPVVATDCCERPRTARVVPSGNHVMMIDAVRATLENPPDLSADRREIVSASAHALQQLVGVYQG